MALYQPSNITPSSFAGIGGGVVDVNDNVSISWQVNGNSPLVGEIIEIFQNNAASTPVYTWSPSFHNGFWGTDAKGNVRRYVFEPGVTWASVGLTNGNEYKMKITQKYPVGDSTVTVEQTSASVFFTRAAPTLSVSPSAGVLTSVRENFTGDFHQAQGDTVVWVRWVLSDGNGGVLDDTGTVYTPVLSYTYNGFFSGESYTLSCTVETSSGVTKTVSNDYTVSYDSAAATGGISTVCNADDSVTLSWSAGVNIPGIPSAEDYGSLSDGVLHLAASRSIIWNEVNGESMSFAAPYAFAWRGKIGTLTDSSQTISSGTWEEYSSQQQIGHMQKSHVFEYMFPDPQGGYYGSAGFAFDTSIGVLKDITVISSTGTTTDVFIYSDDYYGFLAHNDTDSPVTVVWDISYYYDAPAYRSIVKGTLAGAVFGAVTATTASGGATVTVERGNYTVTMYHSEAVSRTATVTFQIASIVPHESLLELNSGAVLLSNTASAFVLSVTGMQDRTVPIPASAYAETAVVFISPTTMAVYFKSYSPSDAWYVGYTFGSELPTVTDIKITGAQDCDYVFMTTDVDYIVSGNFPRNSPAWGPSTLFYASFIQNLQGGTLASSDSVAVALYRREGTSLTPLGVFGTDVSSVRDYGVRSMGEYQYVLYYIADGAYSVGMTSDEICRRFRQFTLIEAARDADDADVYHTVSVWRFRNNIEAGAVSNGNTPGLLDNFTKYPHWQPSSQSPKSGTLTALLSYFSEGEYIRETAADMERLYALSQSVNPLFLRDMKGNLYFVRLSGPISQTTNYKTGIMEVTVSVPWIEVGDASGVKILSLGG